MSDELTEHLARRALADPRVARIVQDAKLFDSLRNDPGWKRLYSMVGKKREKWMQTILDRFMGPKKNWPAPEEIAYHQGFYQGAMYVLAHPEHAEASLERAATIAWAVAQDEDKEST